MGNNIKVVPGTKIPFTSTNYYNHQFSYIDFHDVEMMPSKSSFDDSKTESQSQLKLLMHGKSGIIRIHNIGDTGGLGVGDEGLQIEILSPKDKEGYKNVPSCIRTPAGSIIPQVIIPTAYFKPIDHGMKYPSNVEVKASQESKYKPESDDDDNNEEEEEEQKEGYNWVATAIDKNKLLNRGVPEAIIDKRLNSQLTYGERDVANKGVTNEHSVKRGVDTPIIGNREYSCDLSKTEAGPGSCAICYKFIHYDGVGTGITDEDKRQVPCLNITLAGNIESDGSSGSSASGDDTVDNPHVIKLIVPRAGDCIGAVSAFLGQGAMSVPEADKMPPQCRKNENDYTMMPIFFYPIYSGFVMTNSVLSNLSNGSNGLFIKYNNTNINAIYMAKVNDEIVDKSTEMKEMIKKDKNTEIVHWFPALFQETEVDNRKKIQLYMPKYESIVFGNTAKVQWVKSVGRFAYCPIFFHRKIKFTYYFKGEYQSEGESEGRYYFYPIVSANIGTGDGDGWTGIDKKGGICLYQDKPGSSSSTESDDEEDFGKDKVRFVCNDPEVEEAIYAVDFEFSADSLQRYPIEVFGAVAVYERDAFQFQIENDNGEFKFEKSIRSEFTGALAEQNKFNTNNDSSDPSNPPSNTTSTTNKCFGIITNLSVSSGEDGVTGSVTFDGYPLAQGIKVFRQDQSIGEIDFAVEDEETETQKDENGNDIEVPVKHQLFKGYGMEIATNDSENNYSITAQLFGINRKMDDMKLVCAPFWDGDRLEMICSYFQNYLRLNLKMIDHTVTSYANAKPVSIEKYFSNEGTWSSESNTIINSTNIKHPVFRVPRSLDWRSPAINFGTGTSCFDALKTLGKVCGCQCIPQLDGTIVFYELNNYGIPYYVEKQDSDSAVMFSAADIISISMSPSLDHKFNSISTFGFLVKKDAEGKIQEENNIQFGAFYSKTNGTQTTGTLPEVGVQFPWSRMSVGVESAMYTKPELAEVHQNRIKYAVSEIYQGQIQVRGNTDVNHIYQKINVCGTEFFVLSIEHSLDLSSKIWTTSYGIQCITMPSSSSSE